MSRAKTAKSRSGQCPICQRPAQSAHAPFCSARCRDSDLLNWLGERYTLPAPATNDDVSSDDNEA